ncbi:MULTISPECIES: amino acid ABC transporter permease [Brucella/Ochrobactrum group]|uniref:Polar amino acid ABC transporter, inner membrane subunit n=3 Tax=Brucella anthropi TaxID=529 RepID=A6X5F0_BRUA4|nr:MULTISPECIES: amino acid ABC transporter permease [Brucella/Ochrobactrum group]MCR5939684.1 amino acid ABC transporter permease [Ochrobactrum sp. XJ1]QOD65620.1 amino acid ABC transporter permease [Ochrobactrum sp. MT180101]QTN04844.1 ABC transporter permease subunit [Ochrobactrum sp. EEELCW01]ABS16454.1 polar amino acid ABC transporter, inner membrane subunit [Brucella anthropi ATCC 49188]AIK41440.1 amino ABC transporter, permease, 3-TM region, His/Glu/Gln/Arg/opine family domain protein [
MYNFNFAPVFAAMDKLLVGAWQTIELSCAAMVLGLIVSIVCALGKTSGPKPVRLIIDAYIEIIRNTPFLVQIFFIFFGLPSAGLRLSPNSAALLALVVNFGAYGTEIIRAGIESIHKGQVEAGTALGLSKLQVFRYVIMKPALRTVYPSLTSQFIYLMLTSSVVSVISANELAAAGNDLQSATFASFEVYIVITLMYLVMSIGFSAIFSVIEKVAFKYPLSR